MNTDINPKDMVWINQRQRADGTIVCGHWRRQKRAMTADEKRQALVEQAKAEQRDEGLL